MLRVSPCWLLAAALAWGALAGCGVDAKPPVLEDDPGEVGGGAGAGGAAGTAWKVGRSVLVSGIPLGLYESEPHLARGPSGELAAVFISLAGRRSVALTTSADDGASWAPLSLLEDPDGREGVDPAVAFDAQGGLTVAFLGLRYDAAGNRSDRRLFVVHAPSIAGPLSPPEPLDDGPGGEPLDKPWITPLPDGLLVTWTSDNGSWVRTARRGSGGVWVRSTVMPDGQLRGLSYPCAGSSTQVAVAYLTPGGVFVSSSDDGGLSFPAERTVRVSPASEAVAFLQPSCSAEGDRVWVAYGTQAAAGTELQAALAAEVRVARSLDGGRTFGAPRRALGPGALLNPQLVRAPGGQLAVVAYVQGAGSSGHVRGAVSSDDGLTFLPTGNLAGPLTFDRARVGFGWLGDYLGVSFADGALRLALVDNATQPGVTLARVRFVSAQPP